MIFYFSGTGNSRHAALMLNEHEPSELVNIADAVTHKKYSYSLSEGERVFLVFPVYFGGLPGIVDRFISEMQLHVPEPVSDDPASSLKTKEERSKESDRQQEKKSRHKRKKRRSAGEDPEHCVPEIVGVATYGKAASGCGRQLQSVLKKRGFSLSAFYSVQAPENCIFYMNPPIREAALVQLKYMQERMKDVMDSIDYHHRMPDALSVSSGMESSFMHRFYKGSCKTAKFYATDACISCGLCERVCPVHAIQMKNGRPEWIKPVCDHCTACINRCPQDAIEYGRMTRGRNRYAHPDLGKQYRVEKQK